MILVLHMTIFLHLLHYYITCFFVPRLVFGLHQMLHLHNVVIEDHVWIGTKVTCLKGVHVAADSVVAATTTLCKQYDEKNAVIAGVPGRVTRTGVNWCHERILN